MLLFYTKFYRVPCSSHQIERLSRWSPCTHPRRMLTHLIIIYLHKPGRTTLWNFNMHKFKELRKNIEMTQNYTAAIIRPLQTIADLVHRFSKAPAWLKRAQTWAMWRRCTIKPCLLQPLEHNMGLDSSSWRTLSSCSPGHFESHKKQPIKEIQACVEIQEKLSTSKSLKALTRKLQCFRLCQSLMFQCTRTYI